MEEAVGVVFIFFPTPLFRHPSRKVAVNFTVAFVLFCFFIESLKKKSLEFPEVHRDQGVPAQQRFPPPVPQDRLRALAEGGHRVPQHDLPHRRNRSGEL